MISPVRNAELTLLRFAEKLGLPQAGGAVDRLRAGRPQPLRGYHRDDAGHQRPEPTHHEAPRPPERPLQGAQQEVLQLRQRLRRRPQAEQRRQGLRLQGIQ